MTINLILKSQEFSVSVIGEWILPVCSNIHTMEVEFPKQSNGLQNEIGRLKKLKGLEVLADKASDLIEVRLIAFFIMTTLLTSL